MHSPRTQRTTENEPRCSCVYRDVRAEQQRSSQLGASSEPLVAKHWQFSRVRIVRYALVRLLANRIIDAVVLRREPRRDKYRLFIKIVGGPWTTRKPAFSE